MTAEQGRGVVARITMPRCRKGRGRSTEGESGELDETHFDRDVAAASSHQQLCTANRRCGVDRSRVERRAAQGIHREVALAEGTNDAVFGCGAGIDRERQTGTGCEVIAVAVLLTGISVPGRRILRARAVERGVNAQITTQLDAGVGTRNVEKTGTIQGANPHVLDRFGLYGKISCLRPTHGEKTRR